MLLAGKVIAASVIEVMQNPDVIQRAKDEHQEQLGGEVYQSLIPADRKPAPVKKG